MLDNGFYQIHFQKRRVACRNECMIGFCKEQTGVYPGQGASFVIEVLNDDGVPFKIGCRVIGNQDDFTKELFINGHYPLDDTLVSYQEVRFFDAVQSFAFTSRQYDACARLLYHRKNFKDIESPRGGQRGMRSLLRFNETSR